MICVIRHKKSGNYLTAAISKMDLRTQRWTGDKNVQFRITKNIAEAKLIEDPDMEAVLKWGCEAIPVKAENKIEIKENGKIFEHEQETQDATVQVREG